MYLTSLVTQTGNYLLHVELPLPPATPDPEVDPDLRDPTAAHTAGDPEVILAAALPVGAHLAARVEAHQLVRTTMILAVLGRTMINLMERWQVPLH